MPIPYAVLHPDIRDQFILLRITKIFCIRKEEVINWRCRQAQSINISKISGIDTDGSRSIQELEACFMIHRHKSSEKSVTQSSSSFSVASVIVTHNEIPYCRARFETNHLKSGFPLMIRVMGELQEFLCPRPSWPLTRPRPARTERGTLPKEGVPNVFPLGFLWTQMQNHRKITRFMQPVLDWPMDAHQIFCSICSWKHAPNHLHHLQHRNSARFLSDQLVNAGFLCPCHELLKSGLLQGWACHGLEGSATHIVCEQSVLRLYVVGNRPNII